MSRDIDFDNLSEEDVAYVRDRPWIVDDFNYNNPDTSFDDLVEDSGSAQPGDEIENYNQVRKADLVDELKHRGLDSTGNKDELVARLEKDDEDRANQS